MNAGNPIVQVVHRCLFSENKMWQTVFFRNFHMSLDKWKGIAEKIFCHVGTVIADPFRRNWFFTRLNVIITPVSPRRARSTA